MTDSFPRLPSPGEIYDLLVSLETVEEQLNELARLSVRVLPEQVHCGITMRHRGRTPVTVASSDAVALQLDELQYGYDDGPCLRSLRTGERIVVQDMASDPRWGEYGMQAVANGVLPAMAVPVEANGERLAAFNFYGDKPHMFDDDRITAIESFAQQATGMLRLLRRFSDQEHTTGQLRQALISRAVIDQAIGIVMAQARCDADAAFEILRRASQQRNRKLRDVAADMITAITGEPPRMGREFVEPA
ncbi:GAF and ANTAR domain-containing protein [Marinactinospora thermotolerans]|uniref:GAF and ANTAR domain-containing protein n=1 Tax=Marinactinospora thermotolerans TaxID=531310 RepID=UPI003D8BA500